MMFLLVLIGNVTCTSNKQEPNMKFKVVYKAQTRGSNLEYTIDNKNIKAITNGYDGKNGKIALRSDDKKEIKALINIIHLVNIKNLTPPTQHSAMDRAMITEVHISKNGKEYESTTFDHGNPPVELKPLIDKILALIETVE